MIALHGALNECDLLTGCFTLANPIA